MKRALKSTFLLLVLGLPLYAGQAQSQESHTVNFPPNPSAGSSRRNNSAKATPVEDKSETQAANDTAVGSAPLSSTDPGVVTSDAPIKSVNDLPFVSLEASESPDSTTPTETEIKSTVESAANDKTVTDAGSAATEPPPTVETPAGEATASSDSASSAPTESSSSLNDLASSDLASNAPASNAPANTSTETPSDPTPDPAPTSIYRVGIGDVLDIQLLNSPLRESTLYSVLPGGLLEYPLAGEAIKVVGLTTDEIGKMLISKVRIYETPQIKVNVREYASHNVIVTGLVRDPGTKALRREAVPLFVVLAEAQPRPDAARAVIMRIGSPVQTIDISDTTATSALVYSNDVIRLVPAPPPVPMFFYIAGQIGVAGQRDFHSGMTLTQAIFAAGGVTRHAGSKAKVMRQGADGLLVTTEYNLKKIEQGKDPDPQIAAGDRIEVSRGGW